MTPRVEITVHGRTRSVQIAAIVDTGFSGSFCIPMDVATWVGAQVAGWGQLQLADGTIKRVARVFCGVELLGTTELVQAYLSDADDPLIGTELLDGCRLSVDFDSGKVKLKRKQP